MKRKKKNQQKTLAARQAKEPVHADEQSVRKTALQLTTSKPHYMLNSAERPNLSGYPSLTCSSAANYQQPTPIWPCRYVGRATVVVGSNPTEVRIFSLSPCRPISFLRLSLRSYHLGCEYSTLNHYIYFRKTDRQHTDT